MIFNPESQDKLWQKYYEGDTDVFVRYLSRTMSRKQVVAIKEEFEKIRNSARWSMPIWASSRN